MPGEWAVQQKAGVIAMADPSIAAERWTAWVARGIADDRTMRKRTIAAAAVLAIGLGVWLASVLALG